MSVRERRRFRVVDGFSFVICCFFSFYHWRKSVCETRAEEDKRPWTRRSRNTQPTRTNTADGIEIDGGGATEPLPSYVCECVNKTAGSTAARAIYPRRYTTFEWWAVLFFCSHFVLFPISEKLHDENFRFLFSVVITGFFFSGSRRFFFLSTNQPHTLVIKLYRFSIDDCADEPSHVNECSISESFTGLFKWGGALIICSFNKYQVLENINLLVIT